MRTSGVGSGSQLHGRCRNGAGKEVGVTMMLDMKEKCCVAVEVFSGLACSGCAMRLYVKGGKTNNGWGRVDLY